jgi:hypothetical protein
MTIKQNPNQPEGFACDSNKYQHFNLWELKETEIKLSNPRLHKTCITQEI